MSVKGECRNLTMTEVSEFGSSVEAFGGRIVGKPGKRSGGTSGSGALIGLQATEGDDGLVAFGSPTDPLTSKCIRFDQLQPNRFHEALGRIDTRFTPHRGLLRIFNASSVPVGLECARSGRSLLIVHGTFSNSESLVSALKVTDPTFLSGERYQHILLYDYPSLSSSALANAMVLASALPEEGFPGQLDVVCHSQGALVVRYWLELVAPECRDRVSCVFVGGTLAGTSLAAPHQLRGALDRLGNLARLTAKGSALLATPLPAFGAVAAVAALLEGSIKLFSAGLDVGVALVPGLQGMSRVSTNAELRELHARSASRDFPGYAAVASSFDVDQLPPGALLRKLVARASSAAAGLAFPGLNDLIVDTGSMTELGPAKSVHRATLFTGADVHHTNYFHAREVVDAVRRHLDERW